MKSPKWFLLIALIGGLAAAEEPGMTLKRIEVKDKPFSDATTVETLEAKSAVSIIQRQGSWYQVTTASKQTGWLSMLTIRKGTTAEPKKGASGVKSLFKMFRTGSSDVNVATGVRGLDAADLKKSSPNEDEVSRLEELAVTKADARDYARKQNLKSKKVKYIPEAE